MVARNIEHQQVLANIKAEENVLLHQREINQQKLAVEAEQNERQLNEESRQFEEEISRLVGDLEREHSELRTAQRLTLERLRERRNTSALTIQSWFRGSRVRKINYSFLKEKRVERQKLKELRRIEELDLEMKKRKEELWKAEEEKRKQEEDEKRKVEEEIQKRKEAELKKKEAERLKKEEERKNEEEEQRKKKEEKERKRKEEEERKKKEEEEKKRQAEEKKKKEEERKAEEERTKEQKREEERKQKEEQKRKEEKKKAEEKLKAEEEKKKQEQKRKEEEERRVAEEEKIKQEKKKTDEEKLKLAKAQEEELCKVKEREEDKMNVDKQEDEQTKNKRDGLKEDSEIADGIKLSDYQPTDNKIISSANVDLKTVGGSFDFSLVPDSAKLTPRMSSNSLPSHLEAKRLTWIQECIPWSKVSNEPWKLKPGTKKKPPRRPSSAKKLSPLTDEIITVAARAATLRQVTTVSLRDLPGYSMMPLGQCWGLKCLTMNSCNLVAVEGLHQCRQLQFLDLKNNKVEYVDLKDLGSLQVVNLSNNAVSVLHGFDGCTNLRWLDLSHNHVTRLDLFLDLSANNLLENNHLQTTDHLHKLCLLQFLDLSSNNLLEFADVRNQVLLEACLLQDNSISSLSSLRSLWLPLLSQLNMEQNSLCEIESVENCIMLKVFNIRNNQILDADHLQEIVTKCKYLEELYLHGNPMTEEHIKGLFEHHLPRLKVLDGNPVDHDCSTPLSTSSNFEMMCLTQIQTNVDLRNHFDDDLSSAKSLPAPNQLEMCEIYFRYCDKSFKMAVDHRYAHEYGNISMNIPKAPQTPRSGQTRSVRTKKKDEHVFLNPKDLFEKALKSSCDRDQTEIQLNENHSNAADKPAMSKLDAERQSAASKIQAVYKGYCVRREISRYTELWTSAMVIQAAWREYWTRQKLQHRTGQMRAPRKDNSRFSMEQMLIIEELNRAATVIQAAWRGFILRLKLSAALEFARMQPDMDDDIDEFDMSEFNFDEESLEKGWRPPEVPQIPQSHAVLGKPPIGRRMTPDIPHLDLHPPEKPRHAWRNADSPLSDIKGRQPRPPSSNHSTISLDTPHSVQSRKEEKLSEEWGFHNTRTAALMMQRAKKMKYNADRRKKINRLDPHQRLALFRKLEETTKLNPVRVPARKVLPRKEYFQAKGELIEQQNVHKQQEIVTRVHRTYEWLHTQVGSLDMDSTSKVQGMSSFGSESSLPRISSDVLAGNRMYLVKSPISIGPNDSASVTETNQRRRYSLGENPHVSGHSTHLPQITTHSAGSKEKDKMSWRRKPVDSDVGWGGGRKRKGAK
ncbi:leucine-rich repeat and IQ domain-containing protein 1-like [Gigantopelta aegis]|uniref:leucine-rich repeat and IQ domain-containing protein 1-like n=1 Tax=Gigantopelta aegis TaxID=1735272 RepID=UPI001B88D2D7|nr:leucine-rich repeat and IQ domain-containing protein 1-like [Gigantopelta aegis]